MQAVIAIGILAALCSTVSCKTWTNQTVERPVLVGAFNIQNLGISKLSNTTLMNIIKKVLLRYDLILVQEIVTKDETLMDNLIVDLNKLHPEKNSKFTMQISERLGRGNAKEQYAFIYRDDKFRFIRGHSFPDHEDDFMRPPFIGHFETPTVRDMKSMVVIGIHTQPKNAANETSALAKVYDYAVETFETENAILMGDMNAGCANVRINDWDSIELWRREEFTWLVTHDLDTTLSLTCCPYDRIVIAGAEMEEAIIYDSVNVFKFRDTYGISTDMALAVSDHWPVEVKLKGGITDEAKLYVKPSLCLTVHDERLKSLPPQLKTQKTTLGFKIETTDLGTELYAELTNKTALMLNLRNLQTRYQQLISREAMDTIQYKVEHGALSDISSHDDTHEPVFSALVHFDATEKKTTVHYCLDTTIN